MNNNFTPLDIEAWYRRETYELFKDYDDPFFNITANVNVTSRLKFCKTEKQSFFLHSLYEALKVINHIEEFKIRIVNGHPAIYDVINGGSTILNEDGSFSFSYFDYNPNRQDFIQHTKHNIEKAKENKIMNPRIGELNRIHFSTIPWISFTSFKHAYKSRKADSIPKIVFGKYFKSNQDWLLPVSVLVHHALVDGYHVGKFYNTYEEVMR